MQPIITMNHTTLTDLIEQGYIYKKRLSRWGWTHALVDFVTSHWQLCGNCLKQDQCPIIDDILKVHANYNVIIRVVLCNEGFEPKGEPAQLKEQN